MTRTFVVIACLLTTLGLLAKPTAPPPVHTIAAAFTRTVTRGGVAEAPIHGTLYFQSPRVIAFKVTVPISQWLVYQGDSLTIYYPKERTALHMQNQAPIMAPIFQVLSKTLPDDLGLPKAGFTLARKDVKKGVLYTYWTPPAKAAKAIGQTIIGLAHDRLVSVEVHDPKGNLISRVEYANFSDFNGTAFPLEMTVTRLQGKATVVEKTSYTKPVFNQPLPAEVANFHVPAGVPIKELGGGK